MNIKNAIMSTTLSVIIVLVITSLTGQNTSFAEEGNGYKMANDIYANFTFTFKDGVEVYQFPVFKMEDDYVNKNVSPSFSVQGVVGDSPHLHKALDDAFKHKGNPSYEWNYQLFEVNIDFIKNGEIISKLTYHDCYVDDYKVETLTATYESYLSSSSGFAIIDDINFLCGGVNAINEISEVSWGTTFTNIEYAHTPYTFAENSRSFITFEFDQGFEKVEFPYFAVTGGFEEEVDNVIPGFLVEGTMSKHPLLTKAIQNARATSGYKSGANIDFEATVEFTKDDKVVRTLEFKDCRVDSSKITTQYDKEEGFTGKSGFAFVEEIGFECIGLSTVNDTYEEMVNTNTFWKASFDEKILPSHQYPTGTGPKAVATFTYDHGIEVIDFPIFDQGEILIKSGPTFELQGVVGDFPLLYKHVDDNLALTSTTGANNFLDLFNVDVDLINGDKTIRGFNYVDCRVVDYKVQTQRDKEESYFKGFVLSNTFSFECQGYHPNNPVYDAMFVTTTKADTISSTDLRDTSDWGPKFYQ